MANTTNQQQAAPTMEQTLNQSEAWLLQPSPKVRLISHRVSSSRHLRVTALVSRALPSSLTSTVQQLLVTCQTSMQVFAMPSWANGKQLQSFWRLMMVLMML